MNDHEDVIIVRVEEYTKKNKDWLQLSVTGISSGATEG